MFRLNWLRLSVYCMAAGFLAMGENRLASAQPAIFSFEEDLQSWISPSSATLSQSTFGATDGLNALLIDNLLPGFKGEVATTPNFGPTTAGLESAYSAFALAASVMAAGGNPTLEFDLAWDFSQAQEAGYIQLGLFVNSTSAGGGGYKNYGTSAFINGNSGLSSFPALGQAALNDGVTLTPTGPASARVAVPFGPTKRLNISSGSTFYDIGFQSNGSWEGTVDFAVDNIRFTGVPVFEEYTLFSWETPDNPATPGINEQLEGWMPNPTINPTTQNLSITTTGATEGSSAMQLDRTPLPSGFTWGSVYGLDAETNPSDQVKIDDLVSRINGAAQIAIDITFQDDLQIASPTYSNIWLAITDDTGAYYQAASPGFDVVEAAEQTTQTLVWDLSSFEDFNSDKVLSVDGLAEGTQQLAIVLGTGTDGGSIYQLDNFRLISEVSDSVAGDFDDDGDVDGRDFLVWQRNPSVGSLEDWQNNYGPGTLVASVSVPEPATLSALLLVAFAALSRRQVG